MTALSGELRGLLEKAVLAGREASEAGAEATLRALAVAAREPYPAMTPEQRKLRVALRAKARQLGGGDMLAGLDLLREDIAYQQWHRMLFARFLAENGLLMHPTGVAVTLQECAELAPGEGEPDAWALAARYASAMLPGIFRTDDPAAQVRFAPEARVALERIVAELPEAVFTADDSLGWVYQFWQSKAKKAVNESGVKIGAKELPAVTQLFTEDYMVRFLLENSLGAWWTARHPESQLFRGWEYLRFGEDGTPAAGEFEEWPERAAEVTVMDPCCGSGHFLVAAFDMLRRMRMEEEGLSAREAGDAVLRDNLHGLELDLRCTQISVFALAFAAWRAGGYRRIPSPSVACSGIPVKGQLSMWTKLAGDDFGLASTLEQLHELFSEAPTLGSLIDPSALEGSLYVPDFSKVETLLEQALGVEGVDGDATAGVSEVAAAGVVAAARLMVRTYTLVSTNVPYLARGNQGSVLQTYLGSRYPTAKADLATAFIMRCARFSRNSGSFALVTPQSWLFQGAYRSMRPRMLTECAWQMLAWLGAGAFRTITGEHVKPILVILSVPASSDAKRLSTIDVSKVQGADAKALALRENVLNRVDQEGYLANPDARITFKGLEQGVLLAHYADGFQGISSADYPRFGRFFWETPRLLLGWRFKQSTVKVSMPYGGRQDVLWMSALEADAARLGAAIRGREAWGKRGVAMSQTQELPATLYTGELFDNNAAVILPRDPALLPAIWAFCSSPEFHVAVRNIDQKLWVTNATLVKVPFDLNRWQAAANEAGTLPEPHSSDPTQWLFRGDPSDASKPLQVAVARLLGYEWPEQGTDHLTTLADTDGIVPLVPVMNEQPAAERLRVLLAAAFGEAWSMNRQDALLSQAGYSGKDLAAWLRDGFFQQHVKLFQNRPFIWHIWDGTRDGFSALVNYHKLNTATLERLIYTFLGTWIDRQRGDRDTGVPGAEGQLVAALKLQEKLIAIRGGEPPYDIYVRWKPKHHQPIGWEPDLDDGVRLNIRPFVEAGVLRSKFTINWKKDRGTNPDGSERLNDLHFTLAEKRAAREGMAV